jgi:hypothetical protein
MKKGLEGKQGTPSHQSSKRTQLPRLISRFPPPNPDFPEGSGKSGLGKAWERRKAM